MQIAPNEFARLIYPRLVVIVTSMDEKEIVLQLAGEKFCTPGNKFEMARKK